VFGLLKAWSLLVGGCAIFGVVEAGSLPEFALTNWDGRTITPDSLKGKTTLMVFTYARCVFGCPMITYQLQELDRELGSPADLNFLHISVNPDLDTPEEILLHFKKHGIDPRTDARWLFLSGPADRMPLVLKDYGITVNRTPLEGEMIVEPTPRVFVIGPDGNHKRTFDTYQWVTEDMVHAIQRTR
jgi:protein SCO1/2